MVNEFFICSEDITLSPGYLKGWRIFKVTAVAQNPFKNSCPRQFSKNRKSSGYVDRAYLYRYIVTCIFSRQMAAIVSSFPNFPNCACSKRDLKNNKHNSRHLGRKSYARIFVLGHYLFLEAHSFASRNR